MEPKAVYPAEREAYMAIFDEIVAMLDGVAGEDSESDGWIGKAYGCALAGRWLACKGKEAAVVDLITPSKESP